MRRLTLYALAAIGLAMLLVVFTPFVGWYATQLARPWESDRGDILVVLSAAEPNQIALGEPVMDNSTYWRCFMALVFYRQHPFRRVVVTGRGAAEGMRDFLVFNGVPAAGILVENQAVNTRQNAEFTARILARETGSVVLVTSDVHMFRARRCFAAIGVKVSAAPAPDFVKRAGQYTQRPSLFFGEIEETARIFYYRFRGWI